MEEKIDITTHFPVDYLVRFVERLIDLECKEESANELVVFALEDIASILRVIDANCEESEYQNKTNIS